MMSSSYENGADMIAIQLRQWAINEMNLPSSTTPSVESLHNLYRGHAVNVFRFLIERVRSEQTVKKIHGNLRLKQLLSSKESATAVNSNNHRIDKNSTDTRHQLEQRRSELTTALSAVDVDRKKVQRELDRFGEEIIHVEGNIERLKERAAEIQQRQVLLSAYSQVCHADSLVLNEYTRRISSTKEATRTSNDAQGQYGTALQNIVAHKVSESCNEIERYLSLRRHHSSPTSNKESETDYIGDEAEIELDRQAEAVWKATESVLGMHQPDATVATLAMLATEGARALERENEDANLEREAARLRFRVVGPGHIMDASTEPSQLATVQDLLLNLQKEHSNLFLDSERRRNESHRLSRLNDNLWRQLRVLQTQVLIDCPPVLRDAIITSQTAAVQLAGANARLQELRDVLKRLTALKNVRDASMKKLQEKRTRIEQHASGVEQRQETIVSMVGSNSALRNLLPTLQCRISNAANGTVVKIFNSLSEVTKSSQNAVEMELRSFADMRFEETLLSSVDRLPRVPVATLSLYRFRDPRRNGDGRLSEALKLLNFPFYQTPTALIPHIIHMHTQSYNIRLLVNLAHDTQESRRSSGGWMLAREERDVAHSLLQQISTLEKNQIENLLPLLDRADNDVRVSLDMLPGLRSMVEDWWNQPAQTCAPWIMRDGKTFVEWLQTWHNLTEDLRRLEAGAVARQQHH